LRAQRFAAAMLVAACGRSRGSEPDWTDASAFVLPEITEPVGAARPGMSFVPAGLLHAGSDVDEVPRVADAELPGLPIALNAFYIDVLPWPNESGAIPTTNVTRDEAERLCETKGKRLCTELEWERACKGPNSTRFEYGAAYDANSCEAGATLQVSKQRPSGQRPACRSAFGVQDLHGGPSEWTASTWGRGESKDLGVLRGGNDVDGELATRCAFVGPMAPDERASTTGFRCCAGNRNAAKVDLGVKRGVPFEGAPNALQPSAPLAALGGVSCGPPKRPEPCSLARAWSWRPFANVDLAVAGGCVGRDPRSRCAVAISRFADGDRRAIAEIDTGAQIPEVVLVESKDNRIRIRGGDAHGAFFREASFHYGRVEVKVVH
jgi:sulfatase-modifying factor enzyme 1